MIECLFCNIVKTKNCYLVYEDSLFIAFLDIFPREIGHTLVIPKKHYRWVYDIPEFNKLWEVVYKITMRINTVLKPKFISYVTHGVEIPHAHVHILPRIKNTDFAPPPIKISKEELIKIHKVLLFR